MSKKKMGNPLILRIYFFIGLVVLTISLILLSIVGMQVGNYDMPRNVAMLGILIGITPIELVLGCIGGLTQKFLNRARIAKFPIFHFMLAAIILSLTNMILFSLLVEVVNSNFSIEIFIINNWLLSILPILTLVLLLILDKYTRVKRVRK